MIRKLALGFVSSLALISAANAADMYQAGGAGLKDGPEAYWVSSDIVNSNNQIAVQFVTTNFAYKEVADGTRIPTEPAGLALDSETGWAPGVGVSLSLMRNWFVDNLYFNFQYSYLNGSTDYKGALQSCVTPGCYGSVVGKDGAVVNDFDFRFGKGFQLHPSVMVTPYLGVGFQDWERKVNAGEEYSHGYVGGGLLVQWNPIQRLVLSANGLVGTTFGSNIDVTGAFSGALGDSTIYKAGISGDYAVTRNIHVNAGVEWESFKYGESAQYPLGGGSVWEPDSHTDFVTVKVGVGYAFGADYGPLK